MTKKQLTFICPFCGQNGFIEYEMPPAEYPLFHKIIAKLPENIACERCSRFQIRKREIIEGLRGRVTQWNMLTNEERESVNELVRGKMTKLFTRLCSLYAVHYKNNFCFEARLLDVVLGDTKRLDLVLGQIDRKGSVK